MKYYKLLNIFLILSISNKHDLCTPKSLDSNASVTK